jgi:hypothetical protein
MLRKPKINLKLIILVLLITANVVFTSEQKSIAATIGAINGKYYFSYPKAFKVLVPVEKDFGGIIKDSETSVIFTDDFCRLFRIEFTLLSPQEFTQVFVVLDKIGKNKFLKEFLETGYMVDVILKSMPDASIDYQEYMEQPFNGAYYAEVNLPKGSICESSVNGSPYGRKDAKRGILLFIQGSNIFVVSTQLGVVQRADNKEQERARQLLKDNTLTFAKTIDFL